MTELCELAIKHRTDKVGVFMHHYTPVYDRIFGQKRLFVSKVLEIGIGETGRGGIAGEIEGYQGGASLRMWRDYFPFALIIGCDNQIGALFQDDRIKTFYCDEGNLGSLNQLKEQVGNEFDLIINDASHKPDLYILSTKELLPLLKKDGIYIIEDIHKDHISKVEEAFKDYDMEIIRLEEDRKLPDDNLAIIRRK